MTPGRPTCQLGATAARLRTLDVRARGGQQRLRWGPVAAARMVGPPAAQGTPAHYYAGKDELCQTLITSPLGGSSWEPLALKTGPRSGRLSRRMLPGASPVMRGSPGLPKASTRS